MEMFQAQFDYVGMSSACFQVGPRPAPKAPAQQRLVNSSYGSIERQQRNEVVRIFRSQTPNLRDMAMPDFKTLALTLQCFVT